MTTNLTPAALAAVEWAATIPAEYPITGHPDFAAHFGNLTREETDEAFDEIHRRAEEARLVALDEREERE